MFRMLQQSRAGRCSWGTSGALVNALRLAQESGQVPTRQDSPLGEPLRVPADVVGHEGRDEIIAVIVAWLHPQVQRDACLLTGTLQKLRTKLRLEEWVGSADVHEQLVDARAVSNQRHGVM